MNAFWNRYCYTGRYCYAAAHISLGCATPSDPTARTWTRSCAAMKCHQVLSWIPYLTVCCVPVWMDVCMPSWLCRGVQCCCSVRVVDSPLQPPQCTTHRTCNAHTTHIDTYTCACEQAVVCALHPALRGVRWVLEARAGGVQHTRHEHKQTMHTTSGYTPHIHSMYALYVCVCALTWCVCTCCDVCVVCAAA